MACPQQQRETILVVDDTEAVLLFVTDALELEGYTVLSTGDPEEALAWFQVRTEPIHLLIADVAIPHRNGPALAKELRSIDPNLKVLFMSGSTAEEMAAFGFRIEAGEPCLPKPFSVAELKRAVRATLDSGPLKGGSGTPCD